MPSPPCSTSTSRPAMPRSAPPCWTYVGVSVARTTISRRSRRFVAMTSLREVSGFDLGRMPTRASSGAVSSKIRPFDSAMLMLAMCNHPEVVLKYAPKSYQRGGILPQTFDARAERAELGLQGFVAAVEVVNAVDHRLTLGGEAGDDEARRSPQVGGHHGRALQPLDAAHHGAISLDGDVRPQALHL